MSHSANDFCLIHRKDTRLHSFQPISSRPFSSWTKWKVTERDSKTCWLMKIKHINFFSTCESTRLKTPPAYFKRIIFLIIKATLSHFIDFPDPHRHTHGCPSSSVFVISALKPPESKQGKPVDLHHQKAFGGMRNGPNILTFLACGPHYVSSTRTPTHTVPSTAPSETGTCPSSLRRPSCVLTDTLTSV